MKRFFVIVLGVVGLLVAGSLAAIWWVGAWNILFPSSHHDEVAPALPADLQQPAVLLFSKTNQFRHKEGITGGNKVLSELVKQQNWGVFATENGAIFNQDDLQRFAVVVFQNATGDMLNAAQEQALQTWIEDGGGWLGIHAAGDGSHKGWTWYTDNLIGAEFTAHIMGPQFQTATVQLEQPNHPLNQGIDAMWSHEEEWYSWRESPRGRGFTVLATIDETTYTPVADFMGSQTDLAMGDHPIAWANCVGAGRSFFTAVGHRAVAFENPNVQKQLRNALLWLGEVTDSGC